MSALSFDHVAVPVTDAAAALRLFRDVLGLPLVAAWDGDAWDGADWLMMIFALADGRQVALVARDGQVVEAPAVDLPHHALAAESAAALADWERRLEAAGYALRHEDHGGQRAIYFDAAGMTWEITWPPSRSAPDPAAATTVERWIAARA